jgi:hypothetical protein
LSLPIDPLIERGYLQAILQRFDSSQKESDVNVLHGYKKWQGVDAHVSAYCGPGEMAGYLAECPLSGNPAHDYNEPVKPVAANFAQASGLLKRTIRHQGLYGRVEGMRMGANTMHVYYVVRFENGGIRYFQNFEIEKLIVKDVDFDKIASANTDAIATKAAEKSKSAAKAMMKKPAAGAKPKESVAKKPVMKVTKKPVMKVMKGKRGRPARK